MREIVLGKCFVQNVQEFGNESELLGIVKALAMAIDQLPSDIAEGMIYHLLVTGTLVGKDFSREEIDLSLLELCRIRGKKGDSFEAPTTRWNFLKHTMEYNEICNCVGNELEVGLVLHTIASYLKEADQVDATVSRMDRIIEKLDQKEQYLGEDERRENAMMELFSTVLLNICTYEKLSERYEYICCMARRYGKREFVRAFAALFILMANEPLAYVT